MQVTLTSAALSLFLLIPTISGAFDFKNDKEARSIFANREGIALAQKEVPDWNALKPLYDQVALALYDEWSKSDSGICEFKTLDFLIDTAAKHHLYLTKNTLKSFLIAERALNNLDDVLLYPLMKVIPAYLETSFTLPPKGTCPTDIWLGSFRKLKSEHGKRYRTSMLTQQFKEAFEKKSISREAYDALLVLTKNHWEMTPYSLSQAVSIEKSNKNDFIPAGKVSSPSSFSSKKVRGSWGKKTFRIQLYEKYSSQQIDLIAQEYQKFKRRLAAASMSVVIKYDADGKETETRNLSPNGQYDVAREWLRVAFTEDLLKGSLFQGKKITFEDVISAGLESGVIDAIETEQVLKIDELWNPHLTRWDKVGIIIKKFGGPAMILVPPPFNSFSAVTMTLMETVVFKDHSKEKKKGLGIF